MATRIREKAIARKKNADTRAYAIVKYVRMSPSKVRITLDTIRGKKVEEAIAILANQTTAAAEVCLKLVKSALANAEYKGQARQDLVVDECYVCPGPTLKRLDIRARGRANRLLKRTCHITVYLDSVKE
ncbi:MAG: 50S ribosomal protein L22 [Clostridiales bacterium]|nr:50S ribosomal protein L22 [Clostridiales bacterium]